MKCQVKKTLIGRWYGRYAEGHNNLNYFRAKTIS